MLRNVSQAKWVKTNGHGADTDRNGVIPPSAVHRHLIFRGSGMGDVQLLPVRRQGNIVGSWNGRVPGVGGYALESL